MRDSLEATAIFIAIGLFMLVVVWVIFRLSSNDAQSEISEYRTYYAECMALSEDSEMCSNLAAAKAVR